MKCIVVLLAALSIATAIPAIREKRQTFPKDFPFFSSVDDDTETISSNGPSSFTPFFSSPGRPSYFDDIWRRLFSLIGSVKQSTDHIQDEIDFMFKTFNVSDGKRKSTSNTTVVDGHVVTVNKTSTTGEDGSFHHVHQVVYIRPSETPETEEQPAKPIESEKPAEPVEPLIPNIPQPPNEPETDVPNDKDNEIPQDDEPSSRRADLSKDISINNVARQGVKDDGILVVKPQVEIVTDKNGQPFQLFAGQEKEDIPIVFHT